MSAKPTVFVVDDDAGVRDSIRTLVGSANLNVEVFDSAEAFMETAPDEDGCLVLDVRLDGQDGLELQRELNRRQSKLPVIFLTGHASVRLVAEAFKNGAADFLEKPVAPNKLLSTIQNAISC